MFLNELCTYVRTEVNYTEEVDDPVDSDGKSCTEWTSRTRLSKNQVRTLQLLKKADKFQDTLHTSY